MPFALHPKLRFCIEVSCLLAGRVAPLSING